MTLRAVFAGGSGAFAGARRLAVGAAVLVGLMVAGPVQEAAAQGSTPLQALQNYKVRAEWADKFDATLPAVNAVKSSSPTLSPETASYIEQAIQRYGQIVAQGGWPQVPPGEPTLRLGVKNAKVQVLRQRLMISGDLSQTAGSAQTFDSYVDAAVRRFQLRHGLNPDGVVDQATLNALNVPAQVRLRQLETNLVRVRSMSGYLGDRYVMVNIPAAEIEAVEDGRVRSRHTGVVGKVDRPSPVLSSKIHEINFNPYWTVPVSIIKKDLIPKMKEDPEYLTRNKIKIYRWGNTDEELMPTEIDWNTDEAAQYMFRQEPGEGNSLGTVKINFHNQHQVYLHDTPAKNLFGQDFRFHSSGCVRVQNVRELITWLLEGNDWTRAQVDETIRSGEQLDVPVKTQTAIYFSYITAWATADGVVHFRQDIYDRDGAEGLALR
ncbi:L,D-transpeptidase family protein [Amorphus orientalis]|uniref:Murein L,D-transpeptidase YcbB/YkuD n=1 Tax=Amorphus orientalis TaxID=649198 RepID=A0AAE3VPS8_9HYPH|nr:L,D-transpeptidase family protein [Amorphus orientalis]MDQ0316052.1 murein L,D-transpeptidase YcbB/YkuD [Amorphus orientalis]